MTDVQAPGPAGETTPWEEYGQALVACGLGSDAGDDATAPAQRALEASARLLAWFEEPSLFRSVCLSAGLTVQEAQALAVLCAVEVSVELQRAVATGQGDLSRPRLTLGSLARLFPDPHPGALVAAEDARLRRAALVDLETGGPWASRAVSAAGPLVWALCGDVSLDPDLPPGSRLLSGSQEQPAVGVLCLVTGADRVSRRSASAGALGGAGVLVTRPPVDRPSWDAVVREATLGALGVLVEVEDDVPDGLAAAVRRADHLAWGLSSPSDLPLSALPDVPWRDVFVTDRTATEQEWVAVTGGPAPDGVRLDRHQLELVGRGHAPAVESVRRLAGGHLDKLATRVRPRRGWEDLVLPPSLKEQVAGLVSRHRHRRLVFDEWGFAGLPSRGTVALLSGPSGTGKTLTAEVVAGELGLDLFVLDLSSVMSKYIGETEKNLGALFDAAATGDVVLFFDEADALFGKRSAVSDAKDRYANVEVAYLLQRLERHDGMVLLATNLPNNIDDAFVRRLHATLEYTAPEADQRRGIWERAFPPGCPVKDVDLDLLAREVELSGGAIATAAVTAAFAAAGAGEPVTMERVVAAVGAEYRKQGRLSVPPGLGG